LAGFEVTLYGRFWVTPEAARVRKTDNVEASNADNTAVGENSRKVRNLHYISQIRICEKHR
jgi:hypothetical protein